MVLFQDGLIGGTNSMLEYSYLVKKVVFQISVLPVVKIISAVFVHLFLYFLLLSYTAFTDIFRICIICSCFIIPEDCVCSF
ncbi:MAG: hypothetical protein ACLTSZ_15020 [Lachnospiraceae bacterium]